MRARSCLIFLFSFVFLMSSVHAKTVTMPVLRVAVLQSGTVNWELQHLISQSLDKEHGFQLELQKMASLSAARLALTSGSTDMIVSDWLWAGKRNNAGANLRFIPFSNQIGGVISQNQAALTDVSKLKGKTIGVAGGPLNKSWILLQAAAQKKGINLNKEATIQFGAPPLLSQALKRGQVDLLLTFWHFAAKLEVEGYHKVLSLKSLMENMGIQSKVPMLGYLFNASFEQENPSLITSFNKALNLTKQQLMTNDTYWNELQPLMKADTPELFNALRAGYRQGTPGPITLENVKDAQRFFQLIDQVQTYPNGETLDGQLFYGIQAQVSKEAGVQE